MKPVLFLDVAEEEMLAAAKFYQQQAPGLGTRFLAAIESAVSLIKTHPEAGSLLKKDIRRMLTRRFPYALLYRIDAEEIVILAVMHLRRKPGYWRKRQG